MDIKNFKLSNVFGGKVPGLDAPIDIKGSTSSIEADAFKAAGLTANASQIMGGDRLLRADPMGIGDLKFNTEKIGWTRMKKQEGLPLFGDIDRDRKLNVFDCEPYNRMKQAVAHKVGEATTYTYEAPTGSDVEMTVYPTDVITDAEDITTDEEARKNALQRFWEATGIPQAAAKARAQSAWEEQVREKAREEALGQVYKIKAEDIYKEELKKAVPMPTPRPTTTLRGTPRAAAAATGGAITGIQTGLGQFGRDLTGASYAGAPVALGSKIDSLIGLRTSPYTAPAVIGQVGTAPFEYRVAEAVGPPGSATYSLRVAEAVGTQEDVAKAAEEARKRPVVQTQLPPTRPASYPAYPQMGSQVPMRQTMVQPPPQFAPEREVVSPYSKRPVSYIRGPYKRRPRVQYPIPQYPQY